MKRRPFLQPDRTSLFRKLAERRARGELVVLPTMLPPKERRLYVRATLLEDHQFRIHHRPEAAQAKFDALTESLYRFFRGTPLLYYRDDPGADARLPVVLCVGDVHPENYGVIPNEHGAPVFAIDDYDEAQFAPFSWDVKRGATGFYLLAWQQGFSKEHRQEVVENFVRGYLLGLDEFTDPQRKQSHQFRVDNSPPMIQKLLQSSVRNREKWLKKYVDAESGVFIASEKILPCSQQVPRFQAALDEYCRRYDVSERCRVGHFRIKDVAIRKQSGTSSLGLDRYFVLIDGPSDDPIDDLILELKQSRRSALTGLVPGSFQPGSQAERIVQAHDVHLFGGDPYYGRVTLDGIEFLVRERSPLRSRMDVTALDHAALEEYASICGSVLALGHARSDAAPELDAASPESRILRSIQPDVFIADVWRHARAAAKQLKRDYKMFRDDHARGAFQIVQRWADKP